LLNLSTPQITALGKEHVMRRLFLDVWARDPSTSPPGAETRVGFWDDVGEITSEGLLYHGAGQIGSSGPVKSIQGWGADSNFSIPQLSIKLSGIDPEVLNLSRFYEIRQAKMKLSLAIFDATTRAVVGLMFPVFVGKIDQVPIVDPAAGEAGSITFICESVSRALTFPRYNKRVQEDQKERQDGDQFYVYTNMMREVQLYFGTGRPARAKTRDRTD
jgi:hypothetical protein